jgi:membrane dipeptidase
MKHSFRLVLVAALALPLVTVQLAAQAPGRQKRKVTDEEVARVHASTILIDTHNDITGRTVTGTDIGVPSTNHTDLPRMKKGGMGGQFFAVYVASSYVEGNHSAKRAIDMIDTVKHDIVGNYPNDFMLAATAAEVREARKKGRIAALMGIEGGHAIEDDLRLLRVFFNEGVRYMTLTHTNSNHWADSSGDVNKPNNGLSPFGKEVIAEMNRLGMIVDISHTADKTFWDALETSKAPIFASHSSVRSISNLPRNMTDEMITALGKKGGVIQINFDCGYLNPKVAEASAQLTAKLAPQLAELRVKYKDDPDGMQKAQQELRRNNQLPFKAQLSDVVKHINKAVELAGIDGVGLGSDFDGVSCVPEDLDSVDKWPNLTRALLEEGYSQNDIIKIYGGNTLRLMTDVEKVAAGLQAKTDHAAHH